MDLMRYSSYSGPFGRQEVAVVLAAEFLDQRNPGLAVVLEFLGLERVDDVAQVAGDHVRRKGKVEDPAICQVRAHSRL
jgi:hypothetical protein